MVGLVEKTTVGGPSGGLVSLVEREVAGVCSTRHQEGPHPSGGQALIYSYYILSQLVFLNTPYVRKLVLS